MIIVRVSSATESDSHTFSAATNRTPEWTTHFPRNLRRRREGTGSSFGMGEIAVEITETIHVDRATTPSDLKPPGILPEGDAPGGTTTPEFHCRDAGLVRKASEEHV